MGLGVTLTFNIFFILCWFYIVYCSKNAYKQTNKKKNSTIMTMIIIIIFLYAYVPVSSYSPTW